MTQEGDISLRELVRDQSNTLSEIKDVLTRMEVHNTYTIQTLTEHGASIGKMKAAHQRQKGIMIGLGATSAPALIQTLKSWLGL